MPGAKDMGTEEQSNLGCLEAHFSHRGMYEHLSVLQELSDMCHKKLRPQLLESYPDRIIMHSHRKICVCGACPIILVM